ncbi:hypothetical protein LAZ40_07655 [Cereibacter sphaeroides]|uniref:hypothetical protein n=1 Tax=Rhodobacterales TaxID=204455 RepID=UPI000BBEDB80|nr:MULTISPECIES: hypothetical protein [Paracoccaceae]MCE6958922.1 hypothetical protein [Cereibacter sphaeroides]MCE6968847.1 hypothetical protein [Cereibacter sphaeroides]MCE6973560.1 hypothetical protein [Cereibacter sphaeroides]
MHRLPSLCLLVVALLATGLQPASALDRRVRIVNETGYTIVRFYGSNSGTDNWEEDILGDSVLPSGQSVIINFDDASGYCKFDFRAIFEDDDEVVEPGVNICEVATFTFH